jgi:hypothetical protein
MGGGDDILIIFKFEDAQRPVIGQPDIILNLLLLNCGMRVVRGADENRNRFSMRF